MFEHRRSPLLPRRLFYRRLLASSMLALGFIYVSLGAGMLGYHYFESLSWVDSFANAAMILSGMGPLATLQTTGGKIFAGCYALFSGLAFILITGLIFGPIVHRLFHKFHIETDDSTNTHTSNHIHRPKHLG